MELKAFISQEEIKVRVNELGSSIGTDYINSENVIMVGVLNGASIFMSDLVRTISKDIEIDYVSISSYGHGTTSGEICFTKDLKLSVENKDVIIVEDIIDTGNTMKFLINYILMKGANSVKVCSFLSKPSRREVNIPLDYIGFEISDVFVVGYGLDAAEKYRNLPYVGYIPLDKDMETPTYIRSSINPDK